MITRDDLHWWLELEPELDWHFATTYAEGAPHEYVVAGRTPGLSQKDVARAAHVIRTFGEPMKFFNTTRIYLTTPRGWKHWDMQGGRVRYDDATLINRARVEHVYGVQNAPRTSSTIETEYDGLATTWDVEHGMTDDEKAQTADLIREVFGEKLGRTLDVGCGTGWPLDLGLVESVRYVGIDPSTAMLNALVAKHPYLAGVHPMTLADALERRVLGGTRFDTVLALGGAASKLSRNDFLGLRRHAMGSVLLMDSWLDDDEAHQRMRAQYDLAPMKSKSMTRIGRFVATVI